MAKDWQAELKWAYDNGELGYANEVREYLGMEPIDTKTGGDWGQRAAIGGSKGPDAQLQSAQGFDPEAQRFGEDNFLVNGRLNNPPGFDVGDIAPWGREAAEMGGALIGGTLGAAGGIPTGPGAIATTMAGAGVGGELAGQIYDKGMQLFGGQEDTRDIEEFAKDSALNVAFNTMGAPEFRNPKHYVKYAEELFSPKTKAIAEVEKRGGFLTAGQTGSESQAKREGAVASDPFGGARIPDQRKETQGIFEELIEEATPNATSRETVGAGITEGIGYNMDFGQAKVSEAYRLFDETLESAGGDKLNRISMKALENASAEMKRLREQDLGFSDMVDSDPDLRAAVSAIDQMLENRARNAADPSLELVEAPTYDVVKRLRSIIGKKVGDAFSGNEKSGLKRLYGILTDDLDEGAFEIGGEAALHARKNADALNTQLQGDLKTIDPVFKHADNPTQVYKTLNTSLENNPQLAESARVAMGPEQWNRFVDTWVKNASQTKPGQYVGAEVSSNSLLTNLQKLRQQSPEGYKILMDGREESMDVVQEIAKMVRQGDQYMNRSNTAGGVGMQQMATEGAYMLGGGAAGLMGGGGNPVPGIVGAAVTTGARMLIPKLASAAMTSKRLSKALTAVKGKYGDNLPLGVDLARALLSAGAPHDEIKAIFQEDTAMPPQQAAGNNAGIY